VVTDLFAIMEACNRDDLMIFKANGIITTDEGASKCDPDDQQSYDDMYTLSADGNTITLTYEGSTDSDDITIVSINETTMVTKATIDEGADSYTVTSTMERQ
jgi:hypothetical protein